MEAFWFEFFMDGDEQDSISKYSGGKKAPSLELFRIIPRVFPDPGEFALFLAVLRELVIRNQSCIRDVVLLSKTQMDAIEDDANICPHEQKYLDYYRLRVSCIVFVRVFLLISQIFFAVLAVSNNFLAGIKRTP